MHDQIRAALMEFGPCSTRDLLDYLRSDLALKRGLYCNQDWTMDSVRIELNNLVEHTNEIVRFECKSGAKFRYGVTKFPSYLASEPRFLHTMGVLRRCMSCGILLFECDGLKFHFPARCAKYQSQNYFKTIKCGSTMAIISKDYIYGVIETQPGLQLRLTNEIRNRNSNETMSELWFLNLLAHKENIIPYDRLLPLKTRETVSI